MPSEFANLWADGAAAQLAETFGDDWRRYRPTRNPDGHGGFVETLGAPATVRVRRANLEAKTTLRVGTKDALVAGDIVESPAGEQYRVLGIADDTRTAFLAERLQRPLAV